MTIGEALRAHVLGDASIAALVGTRIYPLRLPQKPTSPSIVLNGIAMQRPAQLRGSAGLGRQLVQIDCWDTTNDAAVGLGALVRQRCEGYAGTWTDSGSPEIVVRVSMLFEDERTHFEEDILGGLVRHSADYWIWFTTASGAV